MGSVLSEWKKIYDDWVTNTLYVFFLCPPMRVAPLLKTANCRHSTLYRRRRVMHLTRVSASALQTTQTRVSL